MEKGTIVRLNNGFGFISQEGKDKDVFFHLNALQNVQFDDLRENDELTFDLEEGPKGLNAINVNKA